MMKRILSGCLIICMQRQHTREHRRMRAVQNDEFCHHFWVVYCKQPGYDPTPVVPNQTTSVVSLKRKQMHIRPYFDYANTKLLSSNSTNWSEICTPSFFSNSMLKHVKSTKVKINTAFTFTLLGVFLRGHYN